MISRMSKGIRENDPSGYSASIVFRSISSRDDLNRQFRLSLSKKGTRTRLVLQKLAIPLCNGADMSLLVSGAGVPTFSLSFAPASATISSEGTVRRRPRLLANGLAPSRMRWLILNRRSRYLKRS
jgi:hypothetical protein